MLEKVFLYNFPSSQDLGSISDLLVGSFILKTCQRTLVLTSKLLAIPQHLEKNCEKAFGDVAYFYLLETICGLKSKLIGENEIVGQFKDSYKTYLETPERDSKIGRILEKLFKDAKEIRTQYLIGLSQKTYASLTRKNVMKAGATKILILGSGQLAEDLLNQFKKKIPVALSARNIPRVEELTSKHQFDFISWDNKEEFISYTHIVNTIGTEEILFGPAFFKEWESRHSQAPKIFVDLGSPSPVLTPLKKEQGVMLLADIFSEGAIQEEYKLEQIEKAREAMKFITEKRKQLFSHASILSQNYKHAQQATQASV